MAKSSLPLFFTLTVTLCSAQNLNNFRVITWNTAGARWDFVRLIMNSGIDVLALQEAGSISTISHELQLANSPLPFYLADIKMSASTAGVTEYVWNVGTATYYLYYYDNSEQASAKQNMAIITRRRAEEIILIPPEIRQNLPNAQAVNNHAAGRAFINRPALGVRFGNSVFFDLHLEPIRARNEATALITSIRDCMESRSNPNLSWLAMGDFNRTPDQLALPVASFRKVLAIVRSGQNTRVTGELDNGVAGGPVRVVPNFTPVLVQLHDHNPSDHTPVRFV